MKKIKKNTVITNQQIIIEEYRLAFKQNHEVNREIFGMFYAIGQPLNDNSLKFNKEQLLWVFNLYELTKSLTTDLEAK